MPETDLDQRLRRALALGHEPDATREAMGSLVQALPRYRARRRALVGATGGSVLGVVGLVIGLVVVGVGGPSPTTVAGGRFGPAAPQAFSAGATCVEVQVGSGAVSCVGQITSVPSNASSVRGPGQSAAAGPEFSPSASTPTATIHVVAGERVVVSLARLSGVSWNRVTWMAAANFGSVSSAERSLKTHLERTNGRTVAVVAHAPHDSFVLVASGSASCASGDGCVPTITERWSITVDVR